MKKYPFMIPLLVSCLLLLPGATLSVTGDRDIHEIWERQKPNPLVELLNRYFKRKAFHKSCAIVIGLSDFTGEWAPLESPYYDAIKVRDFLIDKAGFDYVITLANREATKPVINKYMEEIFPKRIIRGDRFLFYFSGHGTQRRLGNRTRGYLPMLGSGKETWSDMISMDDIERWNENLHQAQHVLFLLDCCFSGLAGIEKKGRGKQLYLDDLAKYGHHLITAGSANQESYGSLKRWGGSLFTNAFIKAISGRADAGTTDFPKDGVVSLTELIEYIKKRLKEEAANDQRVNQSPLVSDLDDNVGEFFFVSEDFRLAAKKVGEREPLKEVRKAEEKGRIREEEREPFEVSEEPRRKAVRMSDWMNLILSAVGYLPPIPDTGKPDFALKAALDSGKSFSERVFAGQESFSAPFKLEGAKSVQFTLYEEDWLSSEQITNTVQVDIEDLILGGTISLLIRNEIFSRYSAIDKNRKTISIAISLDNFDPNRDSGTDAAVSSPTEIRPGTLFDNSVDFSKRDASDYVRVLSTHGSTLSIIWALTSSDNFLEIIEPKEGALISPVFEKPVGNRRRGKGKEFVWVTESEKGGDLILHFHADRPLSRTDYAVFAFAGTGRVEDFSRFLELFFKEELTSFGNYEYHWPFNWDNAYQENFGAVIKALRKHFEVPAERLIKTLDEYIKKGTREQQQFAIRIIEADLNTFAEANERAEHASKLIGQLITVTMAENGTLINPAELNWALNSQSHEILLRAINATSKLSDTTSAREILSRLVLDERQDVSEAAKNALRSMMQASSGEQ
jgi:hypothetical protein